MPGSSTTPFAQVLALALLDILPSTTQTVSAPGDSFLSRLNGWPARSPADASPTSSRMPGTARGRCGSAIPSSLVDLHHLLLAGLPAHLCKNAGAPKRSRIRSIRSQLRTQRFSSLSSFVWLEKYHSRDLSNFCVFTQGLGDKQKLALSVD